ncbi:Very-long-chain (3R)-3-hydroxyacyl-CoA dehydratase PASTICCINO 2A [Dichanthelium oligosanthes]|uniref:Very-long-chain (3R)-3-hydroxyacyl-CoA dehydratase n=1 Tax=Dichanthelium oligosanthes TaxID=888268 RepID=A0A1E5W7A4_9POAL|nr:Very-long-chain (3R)-3-hydroxyacyl-CoA dehydratase PASTICCINO 2A [Dichanthelium oligosanthes]
MASGGSVVQRLYLSVYNWVVFYGWAQVMYYTTLALLASGHEAVYDAVEQPLLFAQTAAFMEVIRYSFFGLKEAFGIIPSWHLWLRYSTFLLLYPIGLVSELGLIYVALPSMKESGKYCLRMPNKWNFSFEYYYLCVLLSSLYIPGFPYLFRYMLTQRKKALSKAKAA